MEIVLSQFIKALAESGLITADEVHGFLDSLPPETRPQDGAALARQLVRRGKLTKFQAQAIYQGKTKGLILGGYVVLDRIGQGGMGQVYKAQHRTMQRIVALKTLPSAATKSARAVGRFHREVKVAARLSHPNIVTAHDAGESHGVHYLVMEYVQGSDLARWVRRHRRLPVRTAIDYLLQAARGLEYAHAEGVIHRDIKPSNLILNPKGTVKVLDMGLARLNEMIGPCDTTAEETLTGTGEAMGTIDYMPPEQAENTKTVDQRADVYSLGCTLFYLLTGRSTYSGDTTVQKLLAHREAPIPSLCAERDDGKLSISVDPGKHRLKVQKDGFQFFTEDFVIESGGATKIRARLELIPVGQAVPDIGKTRESGRQSLPSPTPVSLPEPDPAAWKALLPADAPAAAIAPFDSAGAKKHQEAWAEYLGVPIEQEIDLGDAEKLTMVLIPPGEFVMGSTAEQQTRFLEEARAANDTWAIERIPFEGPRHRVRITRPFRLSRHEVTRGQFRRFVEETEYQTDAERDGKGGHGLLDGRWVQDPRFVWSADPGFEQTDDHPVLNVTWNDATAFCEWLSAKKGSRVRETAAVEEQSAVGNVNVGRALLPVTSAATGKSARPTRFLLPTEAQWEYACRAGSTTAWHCGDSNTTLQEYGWFNVNSGGKTHAAGGLKPNGWALYDMHGNVWEWCADRWGADYYVQSPLNDPSGPTTGSYRVLRGGRWGHLAGRCRSASRINRSPESRYHGLGFRPLSVLADK